jgi:hypothetical protein
VDLNPYASEERNPQSQIRVPAPSDAVMWFSGVGVAILFTAQAVGLVPKRVGSC